MSFAKPTESSATKLSPGDSINNPSSTTCATEEEKRRNRKSRYQQEPRLGYRSGYSVNRSFTQAEIMLLKQILKESGESSVDQFGPAAAARGVGGAWQQQQQPQQQQQQQQQQNSSHGAVGGPASSVKDASNADGTVVFPANEQNPKNRELLTQARKKRTRNVTSPYQARVLRKVLQLTSFPSTEMREALAHALNMHPRTVQIWFQNQRQKAKNNPQVVTNQSVAGVVPHLDGFHSSASDLVLPMSPPGSANGGGMLFSSMAMLPNNSSAGVNGSMAQAISTSVSQQGLLQGSSYAFMPFYQSASATSAAPSSSSYSSAYYLPSATLQLPGYPTPTSAYPPTPTSVSQVSPQPGYPSPTATSPTDEFSNPTLDMLAAAALEAEGDPDDQDDDDEDDSSPQQHHVYGGAKGVNMHHAPAAMCSPDQLRPW